MSILLDTGIFSAPPLGVAYCLAKPGLALNQPRLSVSALTSAWLIPWRC